MVAIYTRAFENDYVSSFTFPSSTVSPVEKHRWLRERFLATFQKPDIRNFKIVETTTGRMAAWARWGFPHELEHGVEREKEKDFDKDEWPQGCNLEVCEMKFGGLHRKRDFYCKKEETYCESPSSLVLDSRVDLRLTGR